MIKTMKRKAVRGGFESTTDFFHITAPSGRCTVRTLIVDKAGWESLKKEERRRCAAGEKHCDWAGVAMDDGKILATRIEPGTAEDGVEADVRGKEDPEPSSWIASTKALRTKLLELLEDDPEVSFLDMHVGGDGKAFFDMSYGDAELRVAILTNPNY